MDLFITNDNAHQNNTPLQPNLFQPINPRRAGENPPSTLALHLIIADPGSDSSLTPGWTVPAEAVLVSTESSIGALFSELRNHLPVRRRLFGLAGVAGERNGSRSRSVAMEAGRRGGGGGGSLSMWSLSNAGSGPAMGGLLPPSSSSPYLSPCSSSSTTTTTRTTTKTTTSSSLTGKLRRPKLEYVRLFLTRSPDGEVVPICDDDADWHFKGGYVRVDLSNRSDMEWRLLKELVVAAGGQFKCYVAIKGALSRSPFAW